MEIETAIGSLGFPIAMAIYLITKFEKTLEANTRALQSLSDCIRNQKKAV